MLLESNLLLTVLTESKSWWTPVWRGWLPAGGFAAKTPFAGTRYPEALSATPHQNRSILASLAATAAVLSALTCCLPVVPLALAATTAGAATVLVGLRPYLLVLSVALIAYAFWQSHRGTRCAGRPAHLRTLLLWASAVIVAVMLLAPDVIANLLAG